MSRAAQLHYPKSTKNDNQLKKVELIPPFFYNVVWFSMLRPLKKENHMITQVSPKKSQIIDRKNQKVTYKFEIIRFSDDPKNEHVLEGVANLSPVESQYLKFILLKNWDLFMVSYMVTQFDADPMETNLDCGGLLAHLKKKGHI